MRRASWMPLGWIVTRLAWIAQRFVSSKSPTRCASAASSCASTAEPWKRRSVLNSLRDLAHEALEGELAHVDFW